MRVRILTSGGDCQALNATMRGLVKHFTNKEKILKLLAFKRLSRIDV